MNKESVDGALEILFKEVNALSNHLRTAPRHGLLNGGHVILEILHRQGPQTVPQIARNRVTSRQSVQVLANRLESERLIQFHPNPGHKRSPLADLTDAGNALLGKVSDHQRDFLNSFHTQASETEILSVVSLLKKLREAVQGQKSDLAGPAKVSAKIEKSRIARRRRSERRPDSPFGSEESKPDAAGSAETDVTEGGLPVNLL